MKKRLILFICGATIGGMAFAAPRVAEDEVRGGQRADFLRYPGRLNRIISREEIRAIGTALADQASAPNRFFAVRNGHYSILRAIDASVTNGFDADIFSIGPEADFVNIGAIRAIIGAYLERRYGYSREDGMLLATFITYYNAVYRGNLAFFRSKYKPAVLRHLTAANAGISLRYFEWPGRTRVVIPLTTRIDTGELTDPRVIEDLRNRPDRGLEERTELTELKQRELDEEKARIEREKEEQRKKDEDLRRLEEEARLERERLERDKAAATTDEEKERLRLEEEALKRREEDLARQRAEQERKDEELRRAEETARRKEEEIARDRAGIARDGGTPADVRTPDQVRRDLQNKQDELARKEEELRKREDALRSAQTDKIMFAGNLYYLKLLRYIEDGHYNNQLFVIDPVSHKVLLASPWRNICGRRYDIFKEGVVVIGYDDNHSARHYLILLDLKELTPKVKGKDNIYWKSFVEIKDDFIYAIFVEEGKYYLGRYNDVMAREAKSPAVDKDSHITFYGDHVFISDPRQKILVLKKTDLSLVETIDP